MSTTDHFYTAAAPRVDWGKAYPTAEPAGLPSEPREIPADEVEVGDRIVDIDGESVEVIATEYRDAHAKTPARVLLTVTDRFGERVLVADAGETVRVVLNDESQAAIGHDLVEPTGRCPHGFALDGRCVRCDMAASAVHAASLGLRR